MQNSAAMSQYKQVGVQSSVGGADPHTLIQMLINGAIERLNTAKMHIQKKNIARKGEDIGRAISIIDGLRSSLDMKKGGEIAENLESLYEYMQRQLLSSNIENNQQKIDEVLGLLNEIRSGWNAIPQDIRKPKQPAK
ncbi:Flagellar biosynthesis protein FliS [hydrothermal vent metagenome]|uniref:Flagellar biosynthesis protein FliS n=1 Tax=hydrothermal vent metagenome TaxID=652676 RepID=A0A3B0XP08_9ZZZZ